MTVTVMTVRLYAPFVHSLKEKRMIVKSLCEKLRNKFHVSVIESGAQDLHQTIMIAIAFLSGQSAAADSMSEAMRAYIERSTDAELMEIQVEQR